MSEEISGQAGATVPLSMLDSILPWLIDIDVFMTPVSRVGFANKVGDTSQVYDFIQYGTAQNDEINWDVVLAAGTWTVEALFRANNDCAILTVQLDGVTVGTIDEYNAALSRNVAGSATGIVVAATGKKRLKLLAATKNASSGGFVATLSHVQLRRTA